jgi:hypothetical protein
MRFDNTLERFPTCSMCQGCTVASKEGFQCKVNRSHRICGTCCQGMLRQSKTSSLGCPFCSHISLSRHPRDLSASPNVNFAMKDSTNIQQPSNRMVSSSIVRKSTIPRLSANPLLRCKFHNEAVAYLCLDINCRGNRQCCGKCLNLSHKRCRAELTIDATSAKSRLEISHSLALKDDFEKFFQAVIQEAIRSFEAQIHKLLEIQLLELRTHIVDIGFGDFTLLGQNVDRLKFEIDSVSGKIRVNLKDEAKFKEGLRKFDDAVRLTLEEELVNVTKKFSNISFRQLYERKNSGSEHQGRYDLTMLRKMNGERDNLSESRALEKVHTPSMSASEFETLVGLHQMLNDQRIVNKFSAIP